MTELEEIDQRIDRCIAKRNGLRAKVQLHSRQLRKRENWLAELGKIRSKLNTGTFALEDDEPKRPMKSKEKLNRYRDALAKYFKDLARSKSNHTAPPVHFPGRAEFGIKDAGEIFVAERIEKELIPAGYQHPKPPFA